MTGKKKTTKKEDDVTSKVIDFLKPEIDKKLESFKTDILTDVKEQISKIKIPTPQIAAPGATGPAAPGVDINGLLSQLQNGNLDMGSIGKMLGGMQPQIPMDQMKDMDSKEKMEFYKMQQQNQLMMIVLPELLKSGSGQNPFMAEMMNRFMMSNITDFMMQKKAFTSHMLKSMGDPNAANQYNQIQENLTGPIQNALGNMGNQGNDNKGPIP